MIFGFNTDVQGQDGVYHVQTEDRGASGQCDHAVIQHQALQHWCDLGAELDGNHQAEAADVADPRIPRLDLAEARHQLRPALEIGRAHV